MIEHSRNSKSPKILGHFVPSVQRLIAVLCLCLTAAFSSAIINIQLDAFPREAVADNRSQITLSLTVRNNDGSIVPNGTRILLSTTLGTFRETIVQTQEGKAQAILIAGNVPGIAKITATEAGLLSNPTVLEVEFVSDKSKLSSSADYVVMRAMNGVEFSAPKQLLTAANSKEQVLFQYGEQVFNAQDAQYNISNRTFRGRKVKSKWFGTVHEFEDLYYDFRKKQGFATEVVETYAISRVTHRAGQFGMFQYNSLDDIYEPLQKLRRLVVVEITRSGIQRSNTAFNPDLFKFENPRFGQIAYTNDELATENSNDSIIPRIIARQVTIVSQREFQFQEATLYQGDQKAISQRLLRLDFSAGGNPLQNLNFFQVNDSQFNVNYPYYLDLQRESSTGIRFRTGQNFSRGVNVNRGIFLDLERTWNRTRSNGSVIFTGLGRDDYNIGFRQFNRLDDQTSASFVLDTPQSRTLIGSANVSRAERGFQVTVNSNLIRSLRGPKFNREDYGVIFEKDPIKIGKLPIQFFTGINAFYQSNESDAGKNINQSYGTRYRLQTIPIQTDRNGAVFNAGVTISQLIGNTQSQVATSANVNYSKSFGSRFQSTLTYDYIQDGFTEQTLGSHQLSGQFGYQDRRFVLSLFGTQSLGVDRFNLFADASMRIAPQYRLGYLYTLSQFAGDSFFDYNVLIAYRKSVNAAEFGIQYSNQTGRWGLVLLGNTRF